MSILFRTKGWLTIAQLLPAWASELAEGKRDANQIERDLRHFLIEDIINGRLDDAGPLRDGRRLGLRLITPENRADYLEGHQARELITVGGTPAAFSFVSNRLLVLQEAVFDFARRHKLPPPSWWTDASTAANEQTGDLPVPEQPAAGEKPNDSAAEQEARAACERSRAIKLEMTARLFADLFWPVSRALRWIAFRDEARIEDSLRAATWYSVQAGRPLRDANPQGTLLRALQDGSLRALKDDKELPREAWANATGGSWPDDVRFRREDVLALWPVERERLLAQARATGSLEPVAQRNAVKGLIRDNLWSRKGTPTEILEAAYGDPEGRQYWELWLFEPLRVYQFAELLAVHHAATEGAPVASVLGKSAPVLDGYLRQIFERLRAAAEAGETWFVGDASVLFVATWPLHSIELRNSDLAVWPREAVAWMHRNPNAEHLVPTTPAQMVDDTAGQHVSGVAMGGTVMAHVPGWERLPDALERVMATTGVAEHQAKLDLCRAITDRKIKVRFLVGKEEVSFRSIGEQVEGMVRHGSDADIPTQLKPSDFDWQQSRQLQPWHDIQGGFGVISGLEVLRADVTKVLCGSGSKGESPQAPSPHEGRQQRRRGKSQPALERAQGIIKELYSDGVPGQATEPNANLCRRVSAKLKDAKLPDVSNDTILRAAGRRK